MTASAWGLKHQPNDVEVHEAYVAVREAIDAPGGQVSPPLWLRGDLITATNHALMRIERGEPVGMVIYQTLYLAILNGAEFGRRDWDISPRPKVAHE